MASKNVVRNGGVEFEVAVEVPRIDFRAVLHDRASRAERRGHDCRRGA
jgi:hypothetical protein